MRNPQIHVSHSQYFQLVSWLKKNKLKIETETPTLKKLMADASNALGFGMSLNAIIEARKDSGVLFVGRKNYHKSTLDRMAALESRFLQIDMIEDRILELEKAYCAK